jgi:hypothetical protein
MAKKIPDPAKGGKGVQKMKDLGFSVDTSRPEMI